MKAEGFFGKNCSWITCALLAGITMGSGSFIFATNYAKLGMMGGGICGPGVFIIFLIIWTVRQTYYRCKTGSWTFPVDVDHPDFPRGRSRLLKKDGSLRWSNLVPFFGNIACNVCYLICMTYAWYFAKLGDMNQGVVSALLALASLVNVVTFYFGFGEKISKFHFIGIILMVSSLICIGLAAGSHRGEEETEE